MRSLRSAVLGRPEIPNGHKSGLTVERLSKVREEDRRRNVFGRHIQITGLLILANRICLAQQIYVERRMTQAFTVQNEL